MTQERQAARATRVLILDEDRVEGGMLAFHLRREGLVVMLMTSAEEAADAIAWAEPDVLLVEVAAQGFDGREFLGQLAHLSVDVFAVADRQLPAEVELDALRLGVIDIMMKPIDPVTLARRLKTRPERKRRGSAAGLPEGGISGDLAVRSVVHLLQMAHRHRLNARLHIEVSGDWAVLLVRHGEVIDAEAPTATGREAAFQMIRATQGAFVLFPLPAETEELSRDDVIRADLATLVADAMGRKEPRTVNVVKTREQDTFQLPHVGSPRGPLAKRNTGPGDDTLEYAAQQLGKLAEGARVRRPGERERDAEDARATVDEPPRTPRGVVLPTPAHGRETVQSSSPRVRSMTEPTLVREAAKEGVRSSTDPGGLMAAPEPVTLFGGRPPIDVPPPLPSPGRSPIESPTVDEGFDESTDQQERQRPRAGYVATQRRHTASGLGSAAVVSGATASAPGPAVSPGSGLRRVPGGSGALRAPGRRSTDPELAALELATDQEERRPEPRRSNTGEYADARRSSGDSAEPRRAGEYAERRRSRWSLGTMVMAGATLVLGLFIVARLAGRETGPSAADIAGDPSLALGQALIDLDEGRRDEARKALATLAVDKAAASEVLAALAKMHYQDRRLVEAQALIERLVERNPSDPEAQAWLGLIQAERKDPKRAGDSFQKALRGANGELAERLKWLVPPANTPPGQ